MKYFSQNKASFRLLRSDIRGMKNLEHVHIENTSLAYLDWMVFGTLPISNITLVNNKLTQVSIVMGSKRIGSYNCS